MRIAFTIAKRLALGLLIVLGSLFFWFNLSGPQPREDVVLGMTFSDRYAEGLGLDWKEAYTAHLDDLGVRRLRLPVYWDRLEPEAGTYRFEDLDWQVAEAGARGAEVILAVGQRVPRWPECHIPGWLPEDAAARQGALLGFIQATVERYRGVPAVTAWQVENEPFLTQFGVCPPLDPSFLDTEIALVRALDPTRPIITSDSGELSLWVPAAKRGDVFGTTLYRRIYNHIFGYVTYPVGPNFFLAKEALVRLLTDQENFMVIELQAEPWANGWVGTVPLPEQFRTMNEDLLVENVDYARRVGFRDIYLWGGEWWYWLKVEKGYPALWDTGRELFRTYAP